MAPPPPPPRVVPSSANSRGSPAPPPPASPTAPTGPALRAACLLLGSISVGPAPHASSSAPSRPAPSRLPGARRPPAPPPPPHRPPPHLLQPARLDEYMDAFNEASVDISGDGLVDEVQDVGRADSSMSVGCARRRGPSQ
ncbi:unnamed protein product [Urochloa humidicola]